MSTARVPTASIKTMRAASRRWWRSCSKPPTSLVRGREHGPRIVERGENTLEVLDLRQVVVLDVERVRMIHQVVLMIALGRIETVQRLDTRRDGPREGVRLIQLRDVTFGYTPLLRVGHENRGAVLTAGIGTLPIELRGIVHDGESDLQELSIGDLRGIESDHHRFPVTGRARTYRLVMR